MSHRVLLINPWIYDFAAYDLWAAPLGLLYIAATLRQAGYDVQLLDCLDRHHPQALAASGRAKPKMDAYGCGKFLRTVVAKPDVFAQVPRYYARYGLPLEAFDAELAKAEPEAVLVTSGMTYWYPGVFEAIRRVKVRYPHVPVLLGGIYATLCYGHAQANSGADAVLAGEGERAALRWLDATTGQSRPVSPLDDLDDLPYPAYDLYDHLDFVSLATSRGCPFHCTYCATDQLRARGFQQRDPHAVAAEIAHWHHAHGVRDIAFYDDALLVNANRHLHVILDDVLAAGLDVRFHTPNGLHARYVDKPLARKMYRAGFKTVRLSLETVNMARQQRIGMKVTDQELAQALSHLQDAGFTGRQLGVYILVGLPEQPLQEIVDSIDFVHHGGARAYLSLFSPIPGTVEWRHAVSQGEIAADADPLLQNNTVFSISSGHLEADACQRVKDYARQGNVQIA